jgi:SAM-dependent methyltransferase
LAGCATLGAPAPEVHYEPSPRQVVSAMLELAAVGPADVVYDLGCGDGRIVIEAALRYGARGVCVEIDPELVAATRADARGVARPQPAAAPEAAARARARRARGLALARHGGLEAGAHDPRAGAGAPARGVPLDDQPSLIISRKRISS